MNLENGGENTNYAVRKCPDVQLNVIGLYKGTTAVLVGAQLLEDDELLARRQPGCADAPIPD